MACPPGHPLFLTAQKVILILIALLSACASAEVTPTPLATTPVIATNTPAPVTLQFWTVLPDKGINEKNLNDFIQTFQKENPSISIKVSSQPSYTDLYRKVVASIAAGTLPDLVTGLDSDILQYARLKALAPLDEYVNDPANGLSKAELGDIPLGLLETTRLPDQDSKIVSLPFARGALAVYYNWSAMQAIGIVNTPRSWDEFKLHAKSLSSPKGGTVRGYAYRPEAATFEAMLLSRGGSLLNAEQSKATFNSQAAIDALLFLGEGLKDSWIYRAEGLTDLNDFAAGKTIFNIASTAAIPVYQNAIAEVVKKGGNPPLGGRDFEWGVSLLPLADPKKPTAIVMGSNIAMMKSSNAKQQAAWQFIKWLMRTKVAAEWTQTAGVLPTRQAARDLLKDFFVKVPQHKQAIEEILPVAHPEPNVRSAPEMRELIDAALAAFESGRASPKAALDDAAAKATVLLSEKK